MNTVTRNIIHKMYTQECSVKSPEFGEFICIENYMNGNLTDQRFKTLKPIHNGYSPGAMSFHYYDDLNIKDYFLKHLNNDYENLPAPKLIKNLETFNDFNNLYCIWIGQDHNIYRITEPDPMPSIRRYIINSDNWNLKSIQKHLKSNKNVIEVKIIDNYFKDLSIIVEFDQEQMVNLNEDYYGYKAYSILGIDKFKYKQTEIEHTDYLAMASPEFD